MGYATLDAVLAWQDNNTVPHNAHIVITDTIKSDANFLVHHFLGNHLRSNRHVVLVGLAHIFNHYFLINRKMGIDLQTYKRHGQFCFIDGLTHLNDFGQGNPYPPARAPTAPTYTLDASQAGGLDGFYNTIKTHVEKQSQPLLILDDASALLFSGFGLRQTCLFLRRLKTLLSSVGGSLVSVVHADETGTEDAEQDAFVKAVLYTADLVLQLQGLGSGFAKDVHGQLSILCGPAYIPGSFTVTSQSLHYKILDNNAHFFARGISQGVL